MSEHVTAPLEQPPDPASLTPDEIAAEMQKAADFLTNTAPHMGRLFGVDLNIKVGQLPGEGAGMASDTRTGDMIVDPTFWFRAGYKSKDAVSYGVCP